MTTCFTNEKITCRHPVTGETLTFSSESVSINGYRSHHPVIVFSDGTMDHEDWFYRVLDKYNGPIVARYDLVNNGLYRGKHIQGICLMNFGDWMAHSPRICTNASKQYTFRRLVAQIENNDVLPQSDVVLA
jgi:hypothetical protein